MKSQVYNQEGKKAGEIRLPANLFGLPWNADLVHQVISALRANQRHNTAQVKDRSAVRGGGKKPWRQKGTGRARHGSIRSPIWRGGGATHGPSNERNYSQKINRQMKTKALFTILSQKQREGEILWVDEVNFKTPKTKSAQANINNWAKLEGFGPMAYRRGKRALVVLPAAHLNTEKSFRNLPSVLVSRAAQLSPLDLVTHRYLVMVNPAEQMKIYGQKN